MVEYVYWQDHAIAYSIETNKKLKNLSIRIDPIRGVIVKNPHFPLSKVRILVAQKAKWIFDKTTLAKKRKSIQTLFEEEEKIFYLGEKISLHVKTNIDAFYKEHTTRLVEQIAQEQSFIMGVKPHSIKFRKAKKRWGSCSYKNELSFNTSLAQLPLECITYIVIHELSHINHKHHQKAFWQCVEEYMPQYKACEKKLKEFIPAL